MKAQQAPAVLEVIGYSGAGKTTLLEKLIPALRKCGVRASEAPQKSG
jgi:molybdopterin-guanine dinucleotide biosynthesis protein